MPQTYLEWMIRHTRTQWWHDSAEAAELALGLERGAIGVTTNPFLANMALREGPRSLWAPAIEAVLARQLAAGTESRSADADCGDPDRRKTHAGISKPARANRALSAGRSTRRARATGIACCPWRGAITRGRPISPSSCRPPRGSGCDGRVRRRGHHHDPDGQLHGAAGRGHCRAARAGIARAQAKGIEPGKCFSVIMIGRLDDFLREVAHDTAAGGERVRYPPVGPGRHETRLSNL